jgi:hypothetical protein
MATKSTIYGTTLGRGFATSGTKTTRLPYRAGSGGLQRTRTGQDDYSSLLADFQAREAGALEANKAREAEIRGIYGDIIGQQSGAFREAGLADIEEAKTRAVGAGTQQMISSGLYGTTTAASLPIQAEAQAQRSRLKLEDIIQQRTTEAKLGLAGFSERIETPYPDYNLLLQSMIAKEQR